MASTEGSGTCFTVALPFVRSSATKTVIPTPDPALLAAEQLPVFAAPQIKNGSELPLIVILDDQEDMRTYLVACLTSEYRVLTEANGEAGLKLLADTIPALVTADLMMSHLDGLAFCRHLRADERTSHIPLILLTGRTDNASRLEALALGADFDVETFTRALALSRIQLYRKLKALTDQSPTDFLRAFRLQRAVDLLAGSTSTVADVAYAVGFNSLSCFGKCFRERFDCPPSEHPRQKTL